MDINYKNNNIDKTNYVLKNYGFQIVKFDVFSSSKHIKDKGNIIEYKLLVEDSGLCIDYKIKFKQIYITNNTTKSHEEKYFKPEYNSRYQIRKFFLEKLEIEHIFNMGKYQRKKYFKFNEKDKLSKINDYLLSINLGDLTFQNIEYILTGSNPGGQGNGNGFLKLKYDDEYLPFGFFLQSINKIKERDKLFEDDKKQILWEEIWEKSKNNIISFEEFLSNNGEIKNLFIKFKQNPENWKNFSKDFEQCFNNKYKKFIDIDKLIKRHRKKGITNFESKYGKDKVNAIKKIFDIPKDNNFLPNHTIIQYAHIYPVKEIRKSFFNEKNEKINLDDISNEDNFLPLDAETHILYDRNELFWDQDGKLNKLLALENNEYYEDKLYIYSKISNNILNTTNIKTYLTKFIELKNK